MLTSLRFIGTRVATMKRPIKYEDFIAEHPLSRARKEKKPKDDDKIQKISGAVDVAVANNSWLDASDFPTKTKTSSGARSSGSKRRREMPVMRNGLENWSSQTQGDQVVDDGENCDDVQRSEPDTDREDGDSYEFDEEIELDDPVNETEDIDRQEVLDELDEIRDDVLRENSLSDVFFYTRVTGGYWTRTNLGVTADGIRGQARGGVAFHFCQAYGFPAQQSFAFSSYERHGALVLGKEYCRRGDYFIRLFLASGNDAFEFAQADLDGYVEGAEFLDAMIEADVESRFFERGMQVRRLVPRVP